ncbi:Uu.00g011130.m01.CDS01 [Anthostomella pinea]|uniref:Uu.00g011130.m01.CDS01 n=1 Tax=Anthostomella pinea TaxID=933095 RepID=A0AAI8YQ01_9PEZI|nr:Uu.00g011130.m01.CDS01 [Anthostomella pinea]
MSSETQPINPARFAEALTELPASSLALKVLELRNSIAHLDYSNAELKPFAEGTWSTIDQQGGTPQPDQDCIDAIAENETVIARMQERINLIRVEVENRGLSWQEFQGKEDDPPAPNETNGTREASTTAPLTNGVNGHGPSGEGQHEAWRDGTFQTGTIRGPSDEELLRQLENLMPPEHDEDDADGDALIFEDYPNKLYTISCEARQRQPRPPPLAQHHGTASHTLSPHLTSTLPTQMDTLQLIILLLHVLPALAVRCEYNTTSPQPGIPSKASACLLYQVDHGDKPMQTDLCTNNYTTIKTFPIEKNATQHDWLEHCRFRLDYLPNIVVGKYSEDDWNSFIETTPDDGGYGCAFQFKILSLPNTTFPLFIGGQSLLNLTYNSPLTSLALLAASSTAIDIEFEFYPSGDLTCSSGSLSALTISTEGQCYNIGNPAESFHIGGPSTQDQVPEGCMITGSAGQDCTGSVDLEVWGPSDGSLCYIGGVNMGNGAPVRSLLYTCL